MEDLVKTGAPFPCRLNPKTSYRNRTGRSASYPVEMLNTEVQPFVEALMAGAVEFDTDCPKGSPITTVTFNVSDFDGGGFPNPDVILSETWDLVGNLIEKSLWYLGKVQAQLNLITGEDRYAKLAFVRRLVEGS